MVLASPFSAEAEIAPGPDGPYVVLDSAVEKVGGVVYYDGSAVVVSLTVDSELGFLRLIRSGDGDQLLDTFTGFVPFAYTTTDCTGTPYAETLTAYNPGGVMLAADDDQKLFAADPAVSEMQTIRSRLVGDICTEVPTGSCTLLPDLPCNVDTDCPVQACVADTCSLDMMACMDAMDCAANTCAANPATTVWPFTEVGDLAASYTPPYSVVPGSTVVPMLSAFFRGGLVLAIIAVFAAYDRLRTR